MPEPTMTIGQVAQQAGVNTSAIRYYERNGILPTPARESGQRRYTPDTVRQLQVLDVAKRAGFSLDEARVVLADDTSQLRDLAARKLPEVDALIERAQAMRAWLATASGCGCQTIDVCRLFDEPGELAITPH